MLFSGMVRETARFGSLLRHNIEAAIAENKGVPPTESAIKLDKLKGVPYRVFFVVAPDGRTAYIAGQVAFDSTGQLVGSGDFQKQADQVYQNLRRALESIGGSLDDLVKTTTFITDAKNIPVLRELRGKYLSRANPPANTLLVIASLARSDLLIEIEGVAVLRSGVRLVH